jgi:ATP-binding cassette subfamily B protein
MSDESDSLEVTDVRFPVVRLITDYASSNAALVAVGILLSVGQNFAGRAPAFLLGVLFDTVLSQQRTLALPGVPEGMIPASRVGQLWVVVGLFAAAFLVGKLISWLKNLTWGAFAYRLQHDLRVDTYDAAQRLEMGFFDDRQTGEIMSVLNNDVEQMEGFFSGTIGRGFSKGGAFLAFAFFMAILNWQFAVVTLTIVPVITYVIYRFYGRISGLIAEIRQVVGELNAQIQNSISGIAVIKTHAAEEFERERVERVSREHYEARVEAIDVSSTYFPVVQGMRGVSVTLTFGIGVYWLLVGPPGPATLPLTAGALVTFVMYSRKMPWLMTQVMNMVRSYSEAEASARRIIGLRTEPRRTDEGGASPDRLDGRIEYDDVTFGYGEEPVLESVSFSAEPGETVGIVGPTGAGKSTLVKLLLRFYDPDEGRIRIDGRDLREYALSSLRSHVGYVSQEPFLFSGTVGENVTYGREGVDDERLWEALRLAGAGAFVEDLPDGLDTEIGERGVKLSGGQRQRLCLARTIVHDPSILVLDEATSHVDNETEVLIQRSIESVTAERTTLIIAHRLSTVRDADRIVVLQDGRVVETGPHEELLAEDGLYANLWRVQAGEIRSLPDEFVERIEARADADPPE